MTTYTYPTLHCTLLCPTYITCPPSVGCPPPAQAGAQAFHTGHGPVQHTPFCYPTFATGCTTTPVGAGPANALQTPPAQGGTYGGAPQTSWQQCFGPPTFHLCTVPPPTRDCTYGAAPGAHQYPITVVTPNTHEQVCMHRTYTAPTHDVNCGTSPVAQGAPVAQQTYALPTLGTWPTVPPATVCCYR